MPGLVAVLAASLAVPLGWELEQQLDWLWHSRHTMEPACWELEWAQPWRQSLQQLVRPSHAAMATLWEH